MRFFVFTVAMLNTKAMKMNKRTNQYIVFVIFFSLFLFFSCKQKTTEKEPKQQTRYDTYSGELNVAADAGLESILNQEEEIFDYMYDSVQTNFSYKNEKEMFEDFKSKKATVLLLSRELEKSEINDLKNLDTIYIRQQALAYDAVALIGSKDFDDENLDMEVLKKYFDPKSSSTATPRLVFENQQSSSVRFVLDKLGYKEKVSSNVYALQSAEEVLNYVAANKNVIGFIPFNRVSDTDDVRVKKILENVKILSLRAKSADGKLIRVSANQSDIAAGDYPLIRTVNAVTRYTYEDNLELLLVGFLSREKGAKIFLKAGLIPVKMPERTIVVNESEVTGSK